MKLLNINTETNLMRINLLWNSLRYGFNSTRKKVEGTGRGAGCTGSPVVPAQRGEFGVEPAVWGLGGRAGYEDSCCLYGK